MIESNEQLPHRKVVNASAYSARVQEAMRYDKLHSLEYPTVITIMRAVAEGHTEETWKDEQKRTVNALTQQPADQRIAHADAENRYEQLVSNLKDLTLWPW